MVPWCDVLLRRVAVGAPMWWKAQKSTPLATVPTPTLPDPNAFDIYVSAAGNVVQSNALLFAMRSANATSQAPCGYKPDNRHPFDALGRTTAGSRA
jgi:hypothetical protein